MIALAGLTAVSIGGAIGVAMPIFAGGFGMFGSGLRTANGLTLSILGAAIGVTQSVALCAGVLIVGTVLAGVYARSGRRPAQA